MHVVRKTEMQKKVKTFTGIKPRLTLMQCGKHSDPCAPHSSRTVFAIHWKVNDITYTLQMQCGLPALDRMVQIKHSIQLGAAPKKCLHFFDVMRCDLSLFKMNGLRVHCTESHVTYTGMQCGSCAIHMWVTV